MLHSPSETVNFVRIWLMMAMARIGENCSGWCSISSSHVLKDWITTQYDDFELLVFAMSTDDID